MAEPGSADGTGRLEVTPPASPVSEATTADPQRLLLPVSPDGKGFGLQMVIGQQMAPDTFAEKLTPELIGQIITSTSQDARDKNRHEINKQVVGIVALAMVLVFTGVMMWVCFANGEKEMAEKVLTHTLALGAGALGGYGLRAATQRTSSGDDEG